MNTRKFRFYVDALESRLSEVGLSKHDVIRMPGINKNDRAKLFGGRKPEIIQTRRVGRPIPSLKANEVISAIEREARDQGLEGREEAYYGIYTDRPAASQEFDGLQFLHSIIEDTSDWVAYSAPGAVFLSGEHAVLYGHPAVYLPIPPRCFVAIKPLLSRSSCEFEFYVRLSRIKF